MTVQRALRAFEGLQDPVATPIATGLIHDTYDVACSSGEQFILQRVNPVFSPHIGDNILAVTQHLKRRGVPTLELVTCGGQPHVDLEEDGLWRLMTRVSGVSFDHAESAEHLTEAGKLVATFHKSLFDFDQHLHPIGFPFHDTRQHIEDLKTALRDHEERAVHGDVKDLAANLFEAASQLPSFDGVPDRVIHGDLKLNNLLFEPSHESEPPLARAIIDLDTLARMPLAFDWGDALRSWCNRLPEDGPEAELDIAYVQASIEGLITAFDETPDPAELESLSHALELVALELSIRFATDALREVHWAWDATQYESAGEHNLSRARGQFDLFRQARASHGELARHLRVG